MTQATNDQFLLAARPVGLPKDGDWQRAAPPNLQAFSIRFVVIRFSPIGSARSTTRSARSTLTLAPVSAMSSTMLSISDDNSIGVCAVRR